MLPGERNEPLFELGDQFGPESIAISKGVSTSESGPFGSTLTVYEGTTVWYRITVTNVGSSAVSQVTLTDSLVDVAGLGAAHCDIHHDLAPGEGFTCAYSLVAVRGTTTNTATADSAQTVPVSADATVVGLRPPLLAISKGVRSDPAAAFVTDLVVHIGTTVTYLITVTNIGDVAANGITLVDDHADLGGCAIPATLAARRVVQLHVHRGRGRRHGREPGHRRQHRHRPAGPAPARGSPALPVISPPTHESLTISKGVRADPGQPYGASLTVIEGTLVFYQITVTNSGDVALSGVTLVDDHADLGGCSIPATLAVAASFTCTYTALAPRGTTVNTATASVTGPQPQTVHARALVVGVPVPPIHSIGITKLVGASATGAFGSSITVPTGTTVLYRITVTNTGSLPLTGVSLGDDRTDLSGLGCIKTTLARGRELHLRVQRRGCRGLGPQHRDRGQRRDGSRDCLRDGHRELDAQAT